MISVFKTSIEKLRTAAATAKAALHQISAEHEASVIRAAKLGDQSAAAFADGAQDAEALETEHFKAETRVRSLAAAVERSKQRLAKAEKELTDAKAQADREASATRCRELADSLKKAKPAAAEATRKIAEIVGSLPASGHYPTDVLQGLEHWVPGALGFFQGDFLDLAIQALQTHAVLIEKGERPADLGRTFDEQSEAYGRPRMSHKAA